MSWESTNLDGMIAEVIDVDVAEADLRRQLLDAKIRQAAEARAAAERLGIDTWYSSSCY
jgi:hypothetical protein